MSRRDLRPGQGRRGTIPVRQRWTVTCETTGKRSYTSRSEARQIARVMNDGISAYMCEDCLAWHVGHSSVELRVAKRERPREMPEGFYAALAEGLAKAREEEDEEAHDG